MKATKARHEAKYPRANAQRAKRWREATPGFAVRNRLSGRGSGEVPMCSVVYGITLTQDPCSYCGGPGGELDHIVPTEHGGTNDWPNLTACCHRCNTSKGKRSLLDSLMRARINDMQENWGQRWAA